MHTVIALGSAADGRVPQLLCRALANRFPLLRIDQHQVSGQMDRDGFLLYDTNRLEQIHLDHAILILKEQLDPLAGLPRLGTGIAIAESHNKRAMQLLSQVDIPVITCGLSGKDTFTLSSIGESSAVVSIQRTISTWDGHEISPIEIPIRTKGKVDHYGLLCCGAVLSIFGFLELLPDLLFAAE